MRTLLVLLLLLAVPATAMASDQSLERTWERYLKTAEQLERKANDATKFDRFVHFVRRSGRLDARTQRAVKADSGDTDAGESARTAALTTIEASASVIRRYLRRIVPRLAEAERLYAQGRDEEADRILESIRKPLRRLERADRRVDRLARRTTRLFERVG